LFRAARAVEQPAWEDAAVDIVCATARRPARKCGVVDAALCHGAAGLGHIFNRFAQATGNEELERAAIDWLQRTLEMCAAPGWRRNTSLLTGSAGIGLALLAAASDLEPDWDQLLLLRLTSPEPGSGADSAQARRSQR
jgi:hypothetical protein